MTLSALHFDWLTQNTSVIIVAASRLVYAIARDGTLPQSKWVANVTNQNPRNAVIVVYLFAAILLCTILPSQVAFTSLVSAGGAPMIAAYGLIALLRLTMTRDKFTNGSFRLGAFRIPFYVVAIIFNGIVFATFISPFYFPITAQNFNFVGLSPFSISSHFNFFWKRQVWFSLLSLFLVFLVGGNSKTGWILKSSIWLRWMQSRGSEMLILIYISWTNTKIGCRHQENVPFLNCT